MVAMITVECTDVGLSTLCKAAITKGMSNLVFIVYYNALGAIILLPFVFRRKRPSFTFSVVCRFFLISLIGSLAVGTETRIAWPRIQFSNSCIGHEQSSPDIYVYACNHIQREMGLLMSLVPLVAMITVEFTDVGMSTLTKAALTKGMSNFVFTVYYNALASLFLLPFFIFRRKRNPITFSVLCRLFLISLIGSLAQILGFTALKYSSPTLLSAMGNLIPIFTFMLSILFRMEKIDIRSSNGVAICMGALISISGAFIVTLYKGPPILISSSSSSSSSSVLSDFHLQSLQLSNWVFGGILMAITCLSSAIWTILTAATVKQFPEKTIIVFYYCIFSTIFCGIFTFIVERNPNSWKLNSHIQTIAVLYGAVFGVVLRNGVHTWCLHDKGPIFVSMFRPMGISIAVFMAVLFLGETLYAGSIIGAIIVTLGFYTVMWGKWKEQSAILKNEVDDYLESNSQKMPLLHSNAKEEI